MGCIQTKRIVINSSNISKIEAPKLNKKNSVSKTSSNNKNDAVDFKKIATGEKIKIKNMISKSETRVEDNYKILNQLGKGSFGSVFKVLHIETGLIRAMKVIKRESLQYQDDDQKFLKEIEILIGTEHPNIIKIYEYYTDETNYYLITEFLSGGELYDTISNWSYFDEEKAGYILMQILSAVNYLHSLKIVHRDIKPENMLVENKLKSDKNDELINIKLIDFGTCNYYDGNKSLTLRVGSPYYIAPEVLKRKYNEKCDIWSCGVILYIMLVGFPPFSGSTTSELLENVAKGKFSMKNSCWNNVSEPAKDLLKKMLEFEPGKRISAQEAIEHPWIINIKQKQIINIDKDYFSSVLKNIKNFNAKEKLQQATIAYIVHFIYSSQEIEGLKKVFKFLDKNGDGRLTYGELRSGFDRVFGRYLSDLEMNKVIEEVDGDNDGYISYEEFLRVAINRKKLLEEKNLKLAFDRFDINRDGKLSREEVKKVLGTQENQYINLLLNHIDKNKDGYISFSEFCDLMNGVVNSTINSLKDSDESSTIYAKFKYSEKKDNKSTNVISNEENNSNNSKMKKKNSIRNNKSNEGEILEKNNQNLDDSKNNDNKNRKLNNMNINQIENNNSDLKNNSIANYQTNPNSNTNTTTANNFLNVNNTMEKNDNFNSINNIKGDINKSGDSIIFEKKNLKLKNINNPINLKNKNQIENHNFISKLSVENIKGKNIILEDTNTDANKNNTFSNKLNKNIYENDKDEKTNLKTKNEEDNPKNTKENIDDVKEEFKKNQDNFLNLKQEKKILEKEIIINADEISDIEDKIEKNKHTNKNGRNKNNENIKNTKYSSVSKIKSSEIKRHNEIFENHQSSSESSEEPV